MKRIYISGPISKGDLAHNIRQADAAMLALMRAGFAPFNPMLSCYAGGVDCQPRDYGVPHADADAKAHGGFRDLTHADWIAADLAWVGVADAVLRLPGESVGADAECAYAAECGVPVFGTIDAVVAAMESLLASEVCDLSEGQADPADDGELIDAAWLEASRALPWGTAYCTWAWDYGGGELILSLSCLQTWVCGARNTRGHCVPLPAPATRGQLRRLLAALGVAL